MSADKPISLRELSRELGLPDPCSCLLGTPCADARAGHHCPECLGVLAHGATCKFCPPDRKDAS